MGRRFACVGRSQQQRRVSRYRNCATSGRTFNVPSEDLGRLVGEWFPFGKHIVSGLYQTVRGIEAAARQRESLVALGTLAAGLAHEITFDSKPGSTTARVRIPIAR